MRSVRKNGRSVQITSATQDISCGSAFRHSLYTTCAVTMFSLQDAYLVRAQTKALDAHPKERGWVHARPDHKAPYCCKQGSFELIALAWLKKEIADKG